MSSAVVFNGIENFVTTTNRTDSHKTILVAKCFTHIRDAIVDKKQQNLYKSHVECVDAFNVPFLLEFWWQDLDDALNNIENDKGYPQPYYPGSILMLDMRYGSKTDMTSLKYYKVQELVARGFRYKVTLRKPNDKEQKEIDRCKQKGDVKIPSLAQHWRFMCNNPGFNAWEHKAKFVEMHGDPAKFEFVDVESDDGPAFPGI